MTYKEVGKIPDEFSGPPRYAAPIRSTDVLVSLVPDDVQFQGPGVRWDSGTADVTLPLVIRNTRL